MKLKQLFPSFPGLPSKVEEKEIPFFGLLETVNRKPQALLARVEAHFILEWLSFIPSFTFV